MSCSDKIVELLDKLNINGHDKPGGTDKNTNHSYVDVYGNALSKYVTKAGALLEIGVQYGGSSLLWHELLPNFKLCLVDNEDKMHDHIKQKLDPLRINYLIRDAYDQYTMRDVKNLHPNGFDIIIDDGPHTLKSQGQCIDLYLGLLKTEGCLIIEDIASIEYAQELYEMVPKVKHIEAEIVDLRGVKGRFDDIVLVIRKREEIPDNKIAVFYHVGQFGEWKRLYQEQINSLCVSGLYGACDFVHVGINGGDELPSTLPKMKIKYNENTILEADTLRAMWEFSNDNPNYRVMYFHTKGATQEGSVHRYNVDAWRHYLEYFIIHEWERNLDYLKSYDCSGTEWIHESGLVNQATGETTWQDTGHYAGNYWWANASYVSKLDPDYLYDPLNGWTRWRSELWVGTAHPKRFNFYNTNDFCKYTMRTYSPHEYFINDDNPVTIENRPMISNKKAKFVMMTMFKNEAKTIGRMLESCYKYIDYYVIQDNGSTDGTPEVVANFFKDKNIPGYVYNVEEGWVGFGWNRDHLLQKVRSTDHGCDWILKMDCDEILEVDNDFDWSVFDDKNLHSFHVPAKSGSTIYQRAWIWNAKLPWRFNHDTAHETIVLDIEGMGENFRKFNLPMSYRQVGFDDGESWSSPTKYVSDALKLEEKMIREGTMLTDLYHFWYIGKSYYDAFKAFDLPLKQNHNNELARRCIFYCLEFLDVTHNFAATGKADRMDEMGYYAMMMVGNSYRYLGDHQNALKYLEIAEGFCSMRNEHLTNIAEIYNDLQDYDKMFLVTNKMTNPSRKNPFPELSFIIESQCYPDTGTYVHELHQIAQSNAKKTNPEVSNPQFNLKVSM